MLSVLAFTVILGANSPMNRACAGSYLRTGDIVPMFGSKTEYVVRIDRVVNHTGATVGWVYVGDHGHKVVQGTAAMSRSDLRRAGIKLSENRINHVSPFPRFTQNPWTDLRIVPCSEEGS